MYKVVYSENVKKKLKKIDKQTAKIIKSWIEVNLINAIDPRVKGKALKGNLKGIWRYRVGDYRIFATIEDQKLTIFLFDIGHRRDIYK